MPVRAGGEGQAHRQERNREETVRVDGAERRSVRTREGQRPAGRARGDEH